MKEIIGTGLRAIRAIGIVLFVVISVSCVIFAGGDADTSICFLDELMIRLTLIFVSAISAAIAYLLWRL